MARIVDPTEVSGHHFTPEQWLQADRIMQEQASRPFESRDTIPNVVNLILKECCFGSGSRKPSFNGVKKRYRTYFLGLKLPHRSLASLVEAADTMMELGVMGAMGLGMPPEEVVEKVKKEYFVNSQSKLHEPEEILKRFKVIAIRINADMWMESASKKKFRIGQVVEHIKTTYYANDPSTTPDLLQERYCQKFLGIDNKPAVVDAYDRKIVTEAWTTVASPRSGAFGSTTPLQRNQRNLERSLTPQTSSYASTPQEFQSAPSSAIESPAPPNAYPYDRSAMHPNKRRRPTSLDTNNTMSTYQSSGLNSNASSSRPNELIFRQRLRDSGFCSASSASNADSRSLVSRMSRLSIDFRICMQEHWGFTGENPCFYCGFPDAQPKPIVFLAQEYASPQRLEPNAANAFQERSNPGMQTMWIPNDDNKD